MLAIAGLNRGDPLVGALFGDGVQRGFDAVAPALKQRAERP
jgi:hypothetical protein